MLGRDAYVGKGVRLALGPRARLTLGAEAWVGDGTRVQATGAVSIGAGTLIGERSVLIADTEVSVGDFCVIGDEVLLSDGVRVGNRVRIGPRACLMPGSEVPDGTVVLARSVVEAPVGDQTGARSRSR